MSATEDKKEDNELLDENALKWGGLIAGSLALVGVITMAGMGWMKEQDREKKKVEIQKQQLAMAQKALQDQQQKPTEAGWPNTIPRNTIQHRPPSPVMELPSETEDYDSGHFISPNAYNTNEQKFTVTDDITRPQPYPIIDPSSSPQQIGNKISRVMSLDDYPQQRMSPTPQPVPRTGVVDDDEDISDIFG